MNGKRNGRPVIFGEVLFDCFPDGSVVLGGAPFNVAWNLQAFGQKPILISRIGSDALGQRVSETLAGVAMDTDFVQTDPARPTGVVNVSLEDGEPTYDIVADSAYDFIEPVDAAALDDAAILYHGSLAVRNETTARTLREMVTTLDVPRFVDVNLREPWWQLEHVLNLLQGATWVKLNEFELRTLEPSRPPAIAEGDELRSRNELEGLLITRGSRGAEWVQADYRVSLAPEPVEQVVDTVGAGDAFASVLLLGLLHEWPMQITLERAQSFAGAVVGLRGATVTDQGFYERCMASWDL